MDKQMKIVIVLLIIAQALFFAINYKFECLEYALKEAVKMLIVFLFSFAFGFMLARMNKK